MRMTFPVLYLVCEPEAPFMRGTLSSLCRVSAGSATSTFIVRDPAITPDVSSLEGVVDGSVVVDVDTSGHDPHGFMPRTACMLSKFHGAFGEFGHALSVPCNWLCVNNLHISSPIFVLSSSKDVFSILLGGNPSAHTDVNPLFVPGPSPVNGYLKIRTHSYDVPGLDRLGCPSIVNLDHVSAVYGNGHGLSKENRCGWDDRMMVLYPEKLTCRPGDGKPEPFRDVVGISPEFWDRYVMEDKR